MTALLVTQGDRLPRNKQVDAIFVHGAPVRDNELDEMLLEKVMGFYHASAPPEGKRAKVVLNGLTRAECRAKNLAYDGHESYLSYLLHNGVDQDDIVLMNPALHTGAESRELLNKAQARGWSRLCIASHPHHQLRCFLTIIALMDGMGFWPNVYNVTHHGIPWNYSMSKPVLKGGGENVEGTFPDHIDAEFERIVTYAQPPVPGGKHHVRNARTDEMFAYLDRRAEAEKTLA